MSAGRIIILGTFMGFASVLIQIASRLGEAFEDTVHSLAGFFGDQVWCSGEGVFVPFSLHVIMVSSVLVFVLENRIL